MTKKKCTNTHICKDEVRMQMTKEQKMFDIGTLHMFHMSEQLPVDRLTDFFFFFFNDCQHDHTFCSLMQLRLSLAMYNEGFRHQRGI